MNYFVIIGRANDFATSPVPDFPGGNEGNCDLRHAHLHGFQFDRTHRVACVDARTGSFLNELFASPRLGARGGDCDAAALGSSQLLGPFCCAQHDGADAAAAALGDGGVGAG